MIYCDGRGSYEVAQRMSDDGTGQRARTASFPRVSASANDDRRACPLHLFPLRLQYTIFPIDLRASTSFRVTKCPLTFAAPIPVSSSV